MRPLGQRRERFSLIGDEKHPQIPWLSQGFCERMTPGSCRGCMEMMRFSKTPHFHGKISFTTLPVGAGNWWRLPVLGRWPRLSYCAPLGNAVNDILPCKVLFT